MLVQALQALTSRHLNPLSLQLCGPAGACCPTWKQKERRLQTTDDRSYTSLKYAHSFPEIVDVTAQVYYDRYDFKIGYHHPRLRLR